MKRLALGTVLFLVSFTTPTPGSANLVFLSQEMGNSLSSIENIRGNSEVIRRNDALLTHAKASLGDQDNAATQHFLDGKVTSQTLTQAQAGISAPPMAQWSISSAGKDRPLPFMPEPAVWLLMVAGFALSGIALRNRSDVEFNSRRQVMRLRPERV